MTIDSGLHSRFFNAKALLEQGILIDVLGAGPVGASIVRLLLKLGLPGRCLRVWSSAIVSKENLLLERYFPTQVGAPKVNALHEIGELSAGTRFIARNRDFSPGDPLGQVAFVCDTNSEFRRAVYEESVVGRDTPLLYVDTRVNMLEGAVFAGLSSDLGTAPNYATTLTEKHQDVVWSRATADAFAARAVHQLIAWYTVNYGGDTPAEYVHRLFENQLPPTLTTRAPFPAFVRRPNLNLKALAPFGFTVDIVGAGASGSALTSELAALFAQFDIPLGSIRVSDFDRLEPRNAGTSQYLIPQVEAGMLKVEALRDLVRRETGGEIRVRAQKLIPGDTFGDIVIFCMDKANPRRDLMKHFGRKTPRPMVVIDLGLGPSECELRVVDPSDGAEVSSYLKATPEDEKSPPTVLGCADSVTAPSIAQAGAARALHQVVAYLARNGLGVGCIRSYQHSYELLFEL